jgi:hypothetical protein
MSSSFPPEPELLATLEPLVATLEVLEAGPELVPPRFLELVEIDPVTYLAALSRPGLAAGKRLAITDIDRGITSVSSSYSNYISN